MSGESILKIQSLDKINRVEIPSDVLKLSYMSELDGAEDWTLVWPNTTKTWVICIHGHGSHGDQLYVRQDIREAWLNPFRNLNYAILTPNLRDNAWMSPKAVYDMHDLITFLKERYDAKEFIFFSGSMGGTSNLIYALLKPDDVTAVVALGAASDLASYYYWCKEGEAVAILEEIANCIQSSYGGNPKEAPDIFEKHSVLGNSKGFNVPLFLAHGAADEIIPVAQSRLLTEKLAEKDSFHYHEIPDGSHDSPLYLAEEAFSWLDKILGWETYR
jgi:pimeloyl-ACP methyl ester carboxylesterase